MLQSKFWQAFFALAPLISFVLIFMGYAVFIYSILSELPQGGEPEPSAIFGGLGFFMIIVFTVVLISLASLVFYIVHAANNPNLRENNLLLICTTLMKRIERDGTNRVFTRCNTFINGF